MYNKFSDYTNKCGGLSDFMEIFMRFWLLGVRFRR